MEFANNNPIGNSLQQIKVLEGNLIGKHVISSFKTVRDLTNLFLDENARQKLDQESVIYKVQIFQPVLEGTEGGLFFGTTWIQPGMVNNEYFMTRGHFHKLLSRSEFYWGIRGTGMLILMDEERKHWGENIYSGSLHYIPANTAHRVANTGEDELVFGACWPSDAGYNYDQIEKNGFSCRLLKKDGEPKLIPFRNDNEF